jgi:hypothetical protein
MSVTFRRLLAFLLEIGVGVALVLSVHIYPHVEWFGNVAAFVAGTYVVLGIVAALSFASTLKIVSKHFEEKRSLNGVKETDASLFSSLSGNPKGAFASFSSWTSGIIFMLCLAACKWYVMAGLHLIFAELIVNQARENAVKLKERIDRAQGAVVNTVLEEVKVEQVSN